MSCTNSQTAVTGRAANLGVLPRHTRINFTERVVQLVHREDITPATAGEWLAAAHLSPDEHTLADAVDALATRDGLLDGSRDPYEVCDATPSMSVRNLLDWAVDEQERRLAECVQSLARPADADVTVHSDASSMAGAR